MDNLKKKVFDKDLDLILKESHNCNDCKIIFDQIKDELKHERETTIKGNFCSEHQKLYNRWKRTLRLHLTETSTETESSYLDNCKACGHPKYKTYWCFCPCCGKKYLETCPNCELQKYETCHHQELTAKCIHCGHKDNEHDFNDKGECLICDCEGLET